MINHSEKFQNPCLMIPVRTQERNSCSVLCAFGWPFGDDCPLYPLSATYSFATTIGIVCEDDSRWFIVMICDGAYGCIWCPADNTEPKTSWGATQHHIFFGHHAAVPCALAESSATAIYSECRFACEHTWAQNGATTLYSMINYDKWGRSRRRSRQCHSSTTHSPQTM